MTATQCATWLPIAFSVLALLGSALTAAWSVAAERTSMIARIDAQQATLTDHEARLRGLELTVERMAQDVSWIRQFLAKADGGPGK